VAAPNAIRRAERYRFEGKIHVDLAAGMEPHAALSGGGGSFSPEPVSIR
jgi:hypothetical protein